jgi:hypothetical protein
LNETGGASANEYRERDDGSIGIEDSDGIVKEWGVGGQADVLGVTNQGELGAAHTACPSAEKEGWVNQGCVYLEACEVSAMGLAGDGVSIGKYANTT